MKKIICVIAVVLVSVFSLTCTAFADDTKYSYGHFHYYVRQGYAAIAGYIGEETKIEIPSSIAGKPVSEIEHNAFKGCSSIEQIEVPDTIMYSYDDSFAGASSLKTISCKSAEVKIIAPKGVEVIYPGGKQTTKETAATRSTTARTKQTAATTKKTSDAQQGTSQTSSSSQSVTVTTQQTSSQTLASDSEYEDNSSHSSSTDSGISRDQRDSVKDRQTDSVSSLAPEDTSSSEAEKNISSKKGVVIVVSVVCALCVIAGVSVIVFKKKSR